MTAYRNLPGSGVADQAVSATYYGGNYANGGIDAADSYEKYGIDTGSNYANQGVDTGKGDEKAGKSTGKADETTGKDAGEAGDSAGQNAAKSGEDTGAAAAKAGERLGAGAAKAGEQVGNDADKAFEDTADAGKQAGKDAAKAGEEAGKDAVKAGEAAAKAGDDSGRDAVKAGEDAGKDAIKAGEDAAKAGENAGKGAMNYGKDTVNGGDAGNAAERAGINTGRADAAAGNSVSGQDVGVVPDVSEEKQLDQGQKQGDEQAQKERARDDTYVSGGTGYAHKYGHDYSPYTSGNWYQTVTTADVASFVQIKLILTQFTVFQGQEISEAWKALFPQILAGFRDGYAVDTSLATVQVNKFFYPEWWLNAVGYFDIPPNKDPNAILFDSNPFSSGYVTVSFWLSTVFVATVVASIFSASVALKYAGAKTTNYKYEAITSLLPAFSVTKSTNERRGFAGGSYDNAEKEHLFSTTSYQQRHVLRQSKYSAAQDDNNL
jgi:hypothetical protein